MRATRPRSRAAWHARPNGGPCQGSRKRAQESLTVRTTRRDSSERGGELLTPEEYVAGCSDNDAKYRQDFTTLQAFIAELNDTLHVYKVAEGDRALLVSAILVALEHPSFKKAYGAESKPKALAKMTVDVAVQSLRDAGVDDSTLAVIGQEFGFLSTSPVLSAKRGKLREIIDGIDRNVNAFRKTHQYRDVLGALYVEFLRHAKPTRGWESSSRRRTSRSYSPTWRESTPSRSCTTAAPAPAAF